MDELLISFLLIAEGTQAFLHSQRMAFLLGLCTDSPAPVGVGSTPRIYIYIHICPSSSFGYKDSFGFLEGSPLGMDLEDEVVRELVLFDSSVLRYFWTIIRKRK